MARVGGHKELTLNRFLSFLRLVLALTVLIFSAWYLSATFLPPGVLRPFFSNRFSTVVGEFTFWQVFLANFLLGFLSIQFMDLFRVGKHVGGLYVLPVFWVIYGLLLGTNSFVFAGTPVPFSLAVLWTRTGFSELLAYTFGYEASREWTLWEQQGLWGAPHRAKRKWSPRIEDAAYWVIGLLLLAVAVAREVQ
jgi:hypothetical protein